MEVTDNSAIYIDRDVEVFLCVMMVFSRKRSKRAGNRIYPWCTPRVVWNVTTISLPLSTAELVTLCRASDSSTIPSSKLNSLVGPT